MQNKQIVPFLKWPGGKRWLAKKYKEYFPKEYNMYIEPFWGSGAVFFSLQPKEAILSDINKELINLYVIMRDNPNLGHLVQNREVKLNIDGNTFFSKHIGIVGSTGSGKSCTVAKILQEAVGIQEAGNINIMQQKNAHIIIFDIHSEYKSAFTFRKTQSRTSFKKC